MYKVVITVTEPSELPDWQWKNTVTVEAENEDPVEALADATNGAENALLEYRTR